ncbi:MAG: GDP-mannose 4,6-dehydratase [Candidatus Acidiferrales bacterium]
MRTLVTGGLGFIGCNLTDRLLREGHEVIVLDNASRHGTLNNLHWLEANHLGKFHWIQGDTRDTTAVEEAIQGVEAVFHFAAQVAVTTSVQNPQDDFSTNAQGTLNVLEAARHQSRKPIFVYTSTNKVYGGMDHVHVEEGETRYAMPDFPKGIPESTPLDFHSPYGCSKGSADQYVHDFFRIYGLQTVVFRMSCIYGSRQFGNEDQGWVAHFVLTALQNGSLTIYGDGKQVRDLLYIDDLVDAFLMAVRKIDRTAGQVYNIGGGPSNAISVWTECSKHLAKAVRHMPSVNFADWRPGDQKIYISDIRKAARDFGWQPKISIPEGLDRLASWAEEAARILTQYA